MSKNSLELGAYNVICDRCGVKFKNYQLRKEWTGLMTCHGSGTNDCWESKHPQLSIRGVPDRQAVPWARPEQPDMEREATNGECNDLVASSITGEAIAGCSIVGSDYHASLADNEPVPQSTFNLNTL